jgi:hypothetical protein
MGKRGVSREVAAGAAMFERGALDGRVEPGHDGVSKGWACQTKRALLNGLREPHPHTLTLALAVAEDHAPSPRLRGRGSG